MICGRADRVAVEEALREPVVEADEIGRLLGGLDPFGDARVPHHLEIAAMLFTTARMPSSFRRDTKLRSILTTFTGNRCR